MSWERGIFLRGKGRAVARQDMSIWVGMCVDRSAVAGYGKGAGGNEAAFE